MESRTAKFRIGDVVRHRVYPFRGVIFDVDPVFSNSDEWWLAIPEHLRPSKDQPFYHLLAENDETEYVAYVSEQNLLDDSSGDPIRHPIGVRRRSSSCVPPMLTPQRRGRPMSVRTSDPPPMKWSALWDGVEPGGRIDVEEATQA